MTRVRSCRDDRVASAASVVHKPASGALVRDDASVWAPMSASSAEFRSVVDSGLRKFGEVLVLARMNRGAGRKDWYLLRRVGDLEIVVGRNRPADCQTAFPGLYLPCRGAAGDELLPLALDLVMSVEESVFGELREGDPEFIDSFAAVPGDEG